MDMKELLLDNVALLRHLKEVGATTQPLSSNPACLRDICDPLSWATCFTSFVAAKMDDQQTRELMACGKIVIFLAQDHGV